MSPDSVTLREAATPALVLDRRKLKGNCEGMTTRSHALGVRLRPHMKTLKSTEVARYAIDPLHGGIAVATLNEAEYFAQEGITDIQYAVCISPDKLPRAARVLGRAPQFSFFIDSLETAKHAMEFARANNAPFRIWLEMDCGEHRTGVDPEDPMMLDLARLLSQSPLNFQGIATHAGHSYRASGPEELRAVAHAERLGAVSAAQRLRAAGIEVRGVSVGSTPTAVNLISGEGLTEIRAGVYMAGDLFQVSLRSLSLDDVAVTVLATVISDNRSHGQIVIDAGGLALSKDRSTAVGPGPDRDYGLVLDVFGRPFSPELTVADVHQEHGEIRVHTRRQFDLLPIGTKVRIVPNHVCMTAAMYDSYLVTEGTEQIVDTWRRTNGWQ